MFVCARDVSSEGGPQDAADAAAAAAATQRLSRAQVMLSAEPSSSSSGPPGTQGVEVPESSAKINNGRDVDPINACVSWLLPSLGTKKFKE